MLTFRDIATIRAALLFWQEEMCPHAAEIMQPYLELSTIKPLSAAEIDNLRGLLNPDSVRYSHYDATRQQLADTQLFANAAEALAINPKAKLATVLLPLD